MIGMTMDFSYEEAKHKPYHILRPLYKKAVSAFGGFAMPIPLFKEDIERYADMFSGIIFTGGVYDICPSFYGQPTHPKTKIMMERQEFEWALFDRFFQTKKPILGVCAGFQLMNVYLGGTLKQHLPDESLSVDHIGNTPQELAHAVRIVQNDFLMLPEHLGDHILVNTNHHQGIDHLAPPLKGWALCPQDHIVEGAYHPKHPFCLGVQWHPEFLLSPIDHLIFEHFVRACAKSGAICAV